MPNSWHAALKKYNEGTNTFCIPRRGTAEYDKVKALQAGSSRSASAPPRKKRKKTRKSKNLGAPKVRQREPGEGDRNNKGQFKRGVKRGTSVKREGSPTF